MLRSGARSRTGPWASGSPRGLTAARPHPLRLPPAKKSAATASKQPGQTWAAARRARAATATATAPQVTCDYPRRRCAGPAVRRRSDGTSTHRAGRLSVRSRSNEPKLGGDLRTGAAIDLRRCARTLVAIPTRRELPTNRGSCGACRRDLGRLPDRARPRGCDRTLLCLENAPSVAQHSRLWPLIL